MNLQVVKILLIIGLIFLSACDITFKRKNSSQLINQYETTQDKKENNESAKDTTIVDRDMRIVNSYYADPANKLIRSGMRKHGKVSKKQEKQLVVGKTVPRGIQVVPLPLELEKILSPLPLNLIRVQAYMQVIVMDVKSRKIVTILKIKN